MYDDKPSRYFNFVRRDIAPLLPEHSRRVLEVGCGAGATLEWLRSSGRAGHTTGIELAADAASAAGTRVDRMLQGPVEQHLAHLEPASFDLILCLDVLEHLVDPWTVTRQLQQLLRWGGSIIISLPNVRHREVLWPLVFRGRWDYQDAGIMDRTHLRFFTRSGAVELLEGAGLRLTAEDSVGTRRGDADHWLNLCTLGTLKPFLIAQHLLRGTRLPG